MQTVKQSYFKIFLESVGNWCDLKKIFSTLSLLANYLIYIPFLIYFPVIKLD